MLSSPQCDQQRDAFHDATAAPASFFSGIRAEGSNCTRVAVARSCGPCGRRRDRHVLQRLSRMFWWVRSAVGATKSLAVLVDAALLLLAFWCADPAYAQRRL
ncbi:MAG: hypothetical protein MHM6MM_008491, partial [Cercozoa sp. M6MM]